MSKEKSSKDFLQRNILGIGLIELCIFVMAFGTVLTAAMPILQVYEVHKRIDVTNSNIAQVQTALDAYYKKNNSFPCPAPFVPVDATNFATAASPVGGCPGTQTSVGRSAINIGAVPTRTLGLPDSAGIDGWKHFLKYAITQSYTTPSATSANMMSGAIYVKDSSNVHNTTASPGIGVYVVVPANPNGAGAYGLNGQIQSPCAGTTGLVARICYADGSNANAFLSTTLQESESGRAVTSSIALRADTCVTGTPQAGACGLDNTVPWPSVPPGLHGSTLASADTACNGSYSDFITNIAANAGGLLPAEWSWICDGTCQAANKSCSTALCTQINAECGSSSSPSLAFPTSAPPTGLCAAEPTAPSGPGGIFVSSVPGASGGIWNWTCTGDCNAHTGVAATDCRNNLGFCKGTDAPCWANVCTPINGACGGGTFTSPPSPGPCAAGISSGAASVNTGVVPYQYNWSCAGTCSGTDCSTAANAARCVGSPTSCMAVCTSTGCVPPPAFCGTTSSCTDNCGNVTTAAGTLSNGACTQATVNAMGCGHTCTDNCGVTFSSAVCCVPNGSCSGTCTQGTNGYGNPNNVGVDNCGNTCTTTCYCDRWYDQHDGDYLVSGDGYLRSVPTCNDEENCSCTGTGVQPAWPDTADTQYTCGEWAAGAESARWPYSTDNGMFDCTHSGIPNDLHYLWCYEHTASPGEVSGGCNF